MQEEVAALAEAIVQATALEVLSDGEQIINAENQMTQEDKVEPIKNEQPAGYVVRAEQLRQEMVKKMQEATEDLHNSSKWTPINPQFSQTKHLPFQAQHKANEFWKLNVANQAHDLFKVLMPRKVITSLMNHTNKVLMSKFQGQEQSELKKRMYKIEQFYEYFGIKILMGFNRMPEIDDYFDDTLPFRSKIGELVQKGRFKFMEQNTLLSDEVLMSYKMNQAKAEFKEFQLKHKIEGEVMSYVMKKFNKVTRLACDSSQTLALIRNTFFDARDLAKEQDIYCLMIVDIRTQFCLHMSFTYPSNLFNCIFRMLEPYRNKNHRVYLQKGLLSLDEVNQLAIQFNIYCSGILAKSQTDDQIQFSGDLVTNGSVMLLKLKLQDGGYSILASTADGFHRNNINDKRAFATVQLQDTVKKAEQYMFSSDLYRCQFSQSTQHGALFTEIQELVIWNSYIAYKEIQRIDPTIDFLSFRLLLAKQLLDSKLKNVPDQSVPLQVMQPKNNSVGLNTDISGNFKAQSNDAIPYSNFHVPTTLIAPSSLQGSLSCLVCKRSVSVLTQCKSCSEISGKLVSLCPSECFSTFHISPPQYITGAEDIPVLLTSMQFEQSAISQSETYQQSYEKKKKAEQKKLQLVQQQQQQMQYQLQLQQEQDQQEQQQPPQQPPQQRQKHTANQFQSDETPQPSKKQQQPSGADRKKPVSINSYLLAQQMEQMEGF